MCPKPVDYVVRIWLATWPVTNICWILSQRCLRQQEHLQRRKNILKGICLCKMCSLDMVFNIWGIMSVGEYCLSNLSFHWTFSMKWDIEKVTGKSTYSKTIIPPKRIISIIKFRGLPLLQDENGWFVFESAKLLNKTTPTRCNHH